MQKIRIILMLAACILCPFLLMAQSLDNYDITDLSRKFHTDNSIVKTGKLFLSKDICETITGRTKKVRGVTYNELKNYYGNSFKLTKFYYTNRNRYRVLVGNSEKIYKGVMNSTIALPVGYMIEYETTTASTEINCIFTCTMAKDLDNDGLSFNDFLGIKRSFSLSEKRNVVVKAQLEGRNEVILEIDFLDSFSGESKYKKSLFVNNSITMIPIDFISNSGIYIMVARIKSKVTNEVISSYKEKFELIN